MKAQLAYQSASECERQGDEIWKWKALDADEDNIDFVYAARCPLPSSESLSLKGFHTAHRFIQFNLRLTLCKPVFVTVCNFK